MRSLILLLVAFSLSLQLLLLRRRNRRRPCGPSRRASHPASPIPPLRRANPGQQLSRGRGLQPGRRCDSAHQLRSTAEHRRLGVHPNRRVAPALPEASTQPDAGFQPLRCLSRVRPGMGRHRHQLSLSTGGQRRDPCCGRSPSFLAAAHGRQRRGPRRRWMGPANQPADQHSAQSLPGDALERRSHVDPVGAKCAAPDGDRAESESWPIDRVAGKASLQCPMRSRLEFQCGGGCPQPHAARAEPLHQSRRALGIQLPATACRLFRALPFPSESVLCAGTTRRDLLPEL